jgi:hypothetical protein
MKFYFPEDGETADDARDFKGRVVHCITHAAELACRYDYQSQEGYGRGDTEFAIAIIDDDGRTHLFVGWHEPNVSHCVREAGT